MFATIRKDEGGWQLQQHVRVARGKECEFRNEIAHESRENASEKRAGGKADLFVALSAAAAFAAAIARVVALLLSKSRAK